MRAPHRTHLLAAARRAIRRDLEGHDDPVPDTTRAPAPLREPGASFVTLRRQGALLGCVGTLQPVRPLIDDVARNAAAASSRDPRLPAVTWDDFRQMQIKVSVLGPLVALEVSDIRQLRRALRPGIDGLLVASGARSATFLPSVWEQLTDVDRFVTLLWDKADLAPGEWPGDLDVFRYETIEVGEPDQGRSGAAQRRSWR